MKRIFCNLSTLKEVPLFASLSEEALTAMLPALQHRTYAARTCILRAGEPADGLYVLLSGQVRICLDDGEGHQAIVSVLGAKEFFGEVGVIDGAPRAAAVHAQQACEVLYMPRKTLLEWLERDPAASLTMLRTLTERLAEAQRKIGSLALMDVYGRVARLLLESCGESQGEWLVQAGSEQIAAMVGASREMVSRVVKDMIGRGIVRRHKRKLVVLDRASLLQRSSRQRKTGGKSNYHAAAPA